MFALGVASCWGGGGEGGGMGGMTQYIFTIRKQHTVNKVQGYRGLTEKWKTVKKSAHFKVQCYKDK